MEAMHTDGNGKALKMREGKPKLSLVPLELMENMARVYEYGLIKYERNSWRKFTADQVDDCLVDAAIRHLMAYAAGETHDPESGLHHLASAAWNCQTIQIITERDACV